MSNISLAAVPMQYYAYLNAQDVVEMILHLPVGSDSKTFIPISKNDESLIGKKYNRQTGAFEDVMFYYAILNDKGIVTEVVALEGQVTEENKILLDTYDQSLVGKWYNKETKQFTEVPIHVLAKADTKEINLVDANGKKLDKWLQTKLDEMDAKTSQVESTCTADATTKYTELNTKVSKVESTCLADSTSKYNTLDSKISQVQSTCLTDSAVKYNTVNAKLNQVSNGSFGGFKTRFKIDQNELITTEWTTYGKRFTFYFNSGISGYFPKMIRLVTRSTGDQYLKADFYIVKNADGSTLNAYVDKSYISKVDGKRKEEYGVSNNNSLFAMSSSSDSGASYFMVDPPSGYHNVSIRNFDYTENSISFTFMPDEAWLNKYTSMSFYAYVY